MSGWLRQAARLVERAPALMVTVCGAQGSAPREPGAKMIVTAAEQWGTIGGGNLEFSAIARAREILAEGSRDASFEDYPLGPAFAQCCGGRVRIGYERLDERDLDWLRRGTTLLDQRRTAILERRFCIGGSPARSIGEAAPQDFTAGFAFLDSDGADIGSAMPPLDQCAGLREAVADERARVYIFGAGHVGLAIAKVLETMPVRATLIDRRGERLPPSAAGLETISSDRETEIAGSAPAGAGYFVLTHSHDLDYELALAILKRGDAFYCGLIGSATKRARFERRLMRAGLDDAALARLTCPIGANGLKSKAPEAIALSAVHELLMAHEAAMEGAWK